MHIDLDFKLILNNWGRIFDPFYHLHTYNYKYVDTVYVLVFFSIKTGYVSIKTPGSLNTLPKMI